MVDKMLKAFELLKSTADPSADSAAKKKDRLQAADTLADAVTGTALRQHPDFQKLLAVAVAGLLAGCSDHDSDVRLHADENLNRTIVTLQETHLLRLQVELYKAIKKEDTKPKSLRAALSKFADLSHLVKPMKKAVFVSSLLPSMTRVIRLNDDSVQETLSACIGKICDSLGLFFSDIDTQNLLAAFLDNLTSSSTVIRRTAADCAIAVCKGSRQPYRYMTVLSNSLFSLVPTPFRQASDEVLLGVLLCFRKVLTSFQDLLGSVTPRKIVMDNPSTERLLDLLLEMLLHDNHTS
eukprot:m.412608 g.412608  ORF g.412608 m.412608 type:complete len:294 (+) comp20171_c0_seq2:368-1249(+)